MSDQVDSSQSHSLMQSTDEIGSSPINMKNDKLPYVSHPPSHSESNSPSPSPNPSSSDGKQ